MKSGGVAQICSNIRVRVRFAAALPNMEIELNCQAGGHSGPPHSWAIGYSSLVPIKWACTCTLNELVPRNTYFQLSQGQVFSIFSRKLQSNGSFGHRVCGPSPPSSHNAMGQAVGACGGPQ